MRQAGAYKGLGVVFNTIYSLRLHSFRPDGCSIADGMLPPSSRSSFVGSCILFSLPKLREAYRQLQKHVDGISARANLQ